MTDHSMFDSLLEPVFIVSAEGKVVYCNEPAALICELSARKIQRGMLFKDLLSFAEDIEWLKDIRQVTGQAPYKETIFTTHSGQRGKVQITAQPYSQSPNQELWIVFVRDVTLEERLQQKYRAELGQKEDVILALQKAQAELEEYSKNLERMVQARTQEISRMNRLMQALLDSLSQGFFIFDKSGMCLEVASKACEHTIEVSPSGKKIWEVLKLPPEKVRGFEKWMTTLFSEMLPFSDLAPLGPATYPHSSGQNISLEYFPLRTDENQIDGVVVVATDITNLVEAQKQALIEKQHSEMIISLVHSKNQVSRFLRESQSMLLELKNYMQHKPMNREAVFRCLHTLKGGAGMLSVLGMTEACHLAETYLTEFNQTASQESEANLREECEVVQKRFDEYKAEAKEILGHAALSEERMLEIPVTEIHGLFASLQNIPAAVSTAENIFGKYVEEPLASFFMPYKEVAQKLAENQAKSLKEIRFVNGDITVFPEIYGVLFSTFVHAFRNAVDHGIETPADRVAAGKTESAEIVVNFEIVSGKTLRVSVSDDGRGIDPAKIRAKIEAKSPGSTSSESDQEVLQHIFDSQFSTSETVTAISGRGVGLDAIRSEALALGGSVLVRSKLGHGSTIIVEVPYLKQFPSLKKAA